MPCQGSFDSFPGSLAVLWFLDSAGLSKALRLFKRGQERPMVPRSPWGSLPGPRFSGLFLGASRALLKLAGCPRPAAVPGSVMVLRLSNFSRGPPHPLRYPRPSQGLLGSQVLSRLSGVRRGPEVFSEALWVSKVLAKFRELAMLAKALPRSPGLQDFPSLFQGCPDLPRGSQRLPKFSHAAQISRVFLASQGPFKIARGATRSGGPLKAFQGSPLSLAGLWNLSRGSPLSPLPGGLGLRA